MTTMNIRVYHDSDEILALECNDEPDGESTQPEWEELLLESARDGAEYVIHPNGNLRAVFHYIQMKKSDYLAGGK